MSQNDWEYYYNSMYYGQTTTNGTVTFTGRPCVVYDLSGGYVSTGNQIMIPEVSQLEDHKVVEGIRAIVNDLEEETDRLASDWDRSFIERTLRDMKADAFDQIKLLVNTPEETNEDEF